MAYFKLAPLAFFVLATFLMFPTKNAEVQSCGGACSVFDRSCGGGNCRCKLPLVALPIIVGTCVAKTSTDEEHPYLCESHDECNKKGIGSFCARFPNSDNKNGWCFASFSEAQDFIKFTTKYKFTTDFLKMPMAA